METTLFDRASLARIATRAAYQVRRSLSIPRNEPLDVFDTAEAIGVEVRFVDAPSLEGMFSRAPHPLVILPSPAHRPRGRLAFTCAHELGHCRLGHGERVDKLVDDPRASNDPEEFAADVFAGTLLMPRPAIVEAFARRNVSPESASPQLLYAIACELGVGLSTLVNHLAYGLRICDAAWARRLSRVTPKSVRAQLMHDPPSSIVLLDGGSAARTIDLVVGETLLVSADASFDLTTVNELVRRADGQNVGANAWEALTPGTASALVNGQGVRVRVSRSTYVGPHRNRFLPDPEAE